MDIRVGRTLPVGAPVDREGQSRASIEARILAVRAPRRRTPLSRPQGKPERREHESGRDPVNGRVLVLMIPDGTELPGDLDGSHYRVFLRFARR